MSRCGRLGHVGRTGLGLALLLLVLALLGVGAGGARAQDDRPAVVVRDPTAQTFKAAVQRFHDSAVATDPARGERLREGIVEALKWNRVFEGIAPRAFLGPETSPPLEAPEPPSCEDWRTIGADALVEGEIRVEGEPEVDRVEVEFRVWDVVRCRSLLRKRYFGEPADLATIARRIADDVVGEFAGAAGVAATEIAFISDRSGRKEVYVMNAEGSAVRSATRNRSINAFPDWHPGGDELVYTSYRMGGQPGLFRLTRGRREPGPLLGRLDASSAVYRGVWAPDGDRLAFVRSVGAGTDLFTARPDGSDLRRLTDNRVIDIAPSWSPDGERLAFVSDRAGAPQVYIMDADGENVRRLTFQGAYNTGPAWSPDGRWIAYESRVGGQFDIWLIDAEGESSFPLIDHPRSDEGPSWSPDGRWLAFSSTRRGRADIYAIGIDGRSLRRLTAGSGNNTSPAWSPYPGKR